MADLNPDIQNLNPRSYWQENSHSIVYWHVSFSPFPKGLVHCFLLSSPQAREPGELHKTECVPSGIAPRLLESSLYSIWLSHKNWTLNKQLRQFEDPSWFLYWVVELCTRGKFCFEKMSKFGCHEWEWYLKISKFSRKENCHKKCYRLIKVEYFVFDFLIWYTCCWIRNIISFHNDKSNRFSLKQQSGLFQYCKNLVRRDSCEISSASQSVSILKE